MSLLIEDNAMVLFQGDSITDADRDYADGSSLGSGYVADAAARITEMYAARGVRFLNRGVSGNRAVDLQERWDRDCIDLSPSWVSIMIGINDTWRGFDSGDPTSTDAFAESYRDILTRTRDRLDARIVIVEPFCLPHPPDRLAWRRDLDPKIQVARALAREFADLYVPMDGIFARAAVRKGAAFWAEDGVHPTPAGHMLIARSWLQTVGAIA